METCDEVTEGNGTEKIRIDYARAGARELPNPGSAMTRSIQDVTEE